MSRIRPLGNRLVVRRWPEIELAESGLWLPSEAREKPQLGDVLAVGSGLVRTGEWHKVPLNYHMFHHYDGTHFHDFYRLPIDIDLTDVVIFEKMVSRDYEVWVDGEPLLILPYTTIYGAIQDAPKLP